MRDTQSAKMALRESPALMASPPAEIREMANQLIDSVTQSVARELAAKIDPNAIYALIEQKLKEQSRRES
jgi:hypothetical protein